MFSRRTVNGCRDASLAEARTQRSFAFLGVREEFVDERGVTDPEAVRGESQPLPWGVKATANWRMPAGFRRETAFRFDAFPSVYLVLQFTCRNSGSIAGTRTSVAREVVELAVVRPSRSVCGE